MPPLTIGAIELGLYIGATGWAAASPWVIGAIVATSLYSTYEYYNAPDIGSFSDTGKGQQVNTQTSQEVIPVVYGRTRVGLNRCYVHTAGTNNEVLHVIGILSEGECDSIYNSEVYLGDQLISTFGTDASYVFHSGTTSQDYDSILHSADSNWIDTLRNTAYIYFTFQYNQDKFANFPDIAVTLNGRKLYDPRGAPGNASWSSNPALVVWDIMTNDFYGLGWPVEYLDEESFEVAATWCETNLYTFNGCLGERKQAVDLIREILTNFRGMIIWSGGKWKLKILDYDAAVLSLDDTDVVDGSDRASWPDVQEVINTVNIKYHNAVNNYTLEDLPIVDDAGINLDGETRPKDVYLNGTTSYTQASKIGAYIVDRAREDDTRSFVCRPRALVLEPGDMISVTRSLYGWVGQRCRVIRVQPNSDYTVSIQVSREEEIIYDDSVNVSTHSTYTTTLPNPLAVPPSVININTEEDSYKQGDNTYYRITITFDPPANYPFFKHVEAYISWDVGVTWRFLGKHRISFTVENLREGQTFKIKLLSVSTYDIAQILANVSALDVEVLGLIDFPSNVGGFQAIATRGDVNFKWNAISDTDLLFYELRYGLSFPQSFLVTRTKGTMYSIHSIRPGQHIFVLKAQNTAGLYSVIESIRTVTTYEPLGYIRLIAYDEEYDIGTHYNTRFLDDADYGRLLEAWSYTADTPLAYKISHSGLGGFNEVRCVDGDTGTKAFDMSSAMAGAYLLVDLNMHFLPPGGVIAVSGDEKVTVSWNEVVGAISYNLYWDTSPGVTKETGNKIEEATSPYVHTGLTNGQPYYYVVTAVNTIEESEESNEVTSIPIQILGDRWQQLASGAGWYTTIGAIVFENYLTVANTFGPYGYQWADIAEEVPYVYRTWSLVGPYLDESNQSHTLLYAGNDIWIRVSPTPTADWGGIYRSINDGDSWDRVFFFDYYDPNYFDPWASAVLNNGKLMLAGKTNASAGVTYVSSDQGATWTPGPQITDLGCIYTLVHLGSGIVLASGGPSSRIYRSIDNGITFPSYISLSDVEFIYVHHVGAGVVLAGTKNSGCIYRSIDNGITFPNHVDFGVHCVAITHFCNISEIGILGVCTYDIDPYTRFIRSINNGQTWSSVDAIFDNPPLSYQRPQSLAAFDEVVLLGVGGGGGGNVFTLFRSTIT